MKRTCLLLGPCLIFCCGCSTMNNTERGLLGGGLLGAGVGTVAGLAVGDPVAGAAIGAGVGAGVGGLHGHSLDRAEQVGEIRGMQKMQAHQAAQVPPLSKYDVVKLAQNHVSDDLIVNQIRESGSMYQLTAEDILMLRRSGVSDRVIMEMQNSRFRQPAPPPPGTVTVIHQTPPPPAVHFGIGYIHRSPGYWRPPHHHPHHHRCWP
jgi:hypothetical protein